MQLVANSGHLLQIRKGLYMLSDTYRKKTPHPFLVANMIKRASYVSLQSALAYYDLIPEYVPNVRKAFEAEAYNVQLKINEGKTVKSSFIRFPGLPYELGLSPHQSEVLAVKIELDTNPPTGGTAMTTIIRRNILLNLFHHDKQSLLAGKLHAILSRSYTKGRDIYDLFWYLSEPAWPEPNLIFLNNALRQTQWKGPEVTKENWVSLFIDQIKTISWSKVVEDVRPFIERVSDLELLTKENIINLLKSR